MYARKEAEGIDWGKQWANALSPLTNLGTDAKGNTNYNYLGTALLGGGTGLVTWALARLLGLKSGASLTAGLLGAFATAYYSLGRQKYGEGFNPLDMEQGKGIFGNIGNQVKNNLEQRKAKKDIDGANTAAENSLKQRIESGTFNNVNPYVTNAPVTTANAQDTEIPPIYDPVAGRNLQGVRTHEAARQRRAQKEAQPTVASTPTPIKSMWSRPKSTQEFRDGIAAEKQFLMDNHAKKVSPAGALMLGSGGMPELPGAPIDITPKPTQIGSGSLTITK